MNYAQMIRNTQSEFLGSMVARLVGCLNLAHRLARVRFQKDCPSNWTYGSIEDDEGVLACRLWQQSDYVTAGNLRVRLRFHDEQIMMTVTREVDGQQKAWLVKGWDLDTDHEDMVGYVTDAWDEVLCAHFGATPLPENKRFHAD